MVVVVGGDVYRTVTIDVIYLTCSVQLSHLFCREPTAATSAFVSGSSKKKKHYIWTETNYKVFRQC